MAGRAFCLLVIIFFAGIAVATPVVDTNVEFVRLNLQPSTQMNYLISFINLAERDEFKISTNSQKNFFSTDKEKILLDNREPGELNLLFDTENLKPGVYFGEVVISSQKDFKSIPVTLELESTKKYFDVSLDISPNIYGIAPEENLIVDINVFNLGAFEKNVVLSLKLADTSGAIFFEEEKNIEVEDKVEISRNLKLPAGMKEGNYILSAGVKQGDSVGVASALFAVSNGPNLSPKDGKIYLNYTIYLIAFLISSLFIMNYFWKRRLKTRAENWHVHLKKIKEADLSNTPNKIAKLKYQKRVLENAFKKKHIKKSTYNEGKRRINQTISQLKKRL